MWGKKVEERKTTTQVGTRNIKLGRKNNSRAVDGEWNGIYNIKKIDNFCNKFQSTGKP